MLFSAGLPSIGTGRLKNRDKPSGGQGGSKARSTEHKLLLPSTDWYKNLAFKFSHDQVTVDLFLCSMHYTDVATLN